MVKAIFCKHEGENISWFDTTVMQCTYLNSPSCGMCTYVTKGLGNGKAASEQRRTLLSQKLAPR